MSDEFELGPGQGTELDLAIDEGEVILILKRKKNGTIEIPTFITNRTGLTQGEISTAVLSLCQEAVRQFTRRN